MTEISSKMWFQQSCKTLDIGYIVRDYGYGSYPFWFKKFIFSSLCIRRRKFRRIQQYRYLGAISGWAERRWADCKTWSAKMPHFRKKFRQADRISYVELPMGGFWNVDPLLPGTTVGDHNNGPEINNIKSLSYFRMEYDCCEGTKLCFRKLRRTRTGSKLRVAGKVWGRRDFLILISKYTSQNKVTEVSGNLVGGIVYTVLGDWRICIWFNLLL